MELSCKRKICPSNPKMHKTISHNAPLCNKTVPISVTKWCVVGHGTGAFWDLWEWSIEFEPNVCIINRPDFAYHVWPKIGNTLRWRHNGHDSVSNHQPRDCFLNRLFRHRSKKTSKLRITGLCVCVGGGIHRGPAILSRPQCVKWTL